MSIAVAKNNNKYKIQTPSGFCDFDAIAKINEPQIIISIELETTSIDVTPGHEFICGEESICARELVEGMCIETVRGLERVKSITLKDKANVYDVLEVQTPKHLFIANNIVNHNCRFLGSSNTLIDPDVLERIETYSPIQLKWNGALQIYLLPEPGVEYVLGIDPGKGTRRDYSVIQVIAIYSERSVEQVAIYRSNEIDTHSFAQVCISVSEFYNGAEMMIENNGCGEGLLNTLWYEYECDKVINCEKSGLGVNANKISKLNANLNTKRYIEEGWCKIHSEVTVYELSRYIEHTLNVFACETNDGHDDAVTSLNWALWFLRTPYFTGKRIKHKPEVEDKFKLTKEEKDALPAVIMNDEEEQVQEEGIIMWDGEGY